MEDVLAAVLSSPVLKDLQPRFDHSDGALHLLYNSSPNLHLDSDDELEYCWPNKLWRVAVLTRHTLDLKVCL